MKLRAWLKVCLAGLFFILCYQACTPTYRYKENAVPAPITLGPRLEALFSKTQQFCFGRYILEVPEGTKLRWGTVYLPGTVEVLNGDLGQLHQLVEESIAEIRRKDNTAEITHNQIGPVEDSWHIRYYPGKIDKKYGFYFYKSFIHKDNTIFVLGESKAENETEEMLAIREAHRAASLRLLMSHEVPQGPGFCIDQGFLPSGDYNQQEMVSVGIHIPSLPDVTFSISSNKDAYIDYPKERFEEMRHTELSLLARIRDAKRDQGLFYPFRRVLREGKRDVQHWHGEESLIRRKDGTHDFDWALVGTPGDVANPSDFGVSMYTKVAHNLVGAAKEASLSDDEAVALWDRLLSGLKFRVRVPGAPPGSYYLPRAEASEPPTGP